MELVMYIALGIDQDERLPLSFLMSQTRSSLKRAPQTEANREIGKTAADPSQGQGKQDPSTPDIR